MARNLGDGYCDDQANNVVCEFDKGDCCLLDAKSKDYCDECICKERKEPETCEISPRNLGDNICDDRANIEACEFDKGDCCLLDIKSKKFCKECLCKEIKESKPEDSKYTGEYCGRRPGERDTSFSFTNGANVSSTKVNTKFDILRHELWSFNPKRCGLFGQLRRRGGDQSVPFSDNGLWWPQFSFKLHKQYLI